VSGGRGDERVRVGELDLRVRRVGSGRPLLLINGIGAPVEMWKPLAGRLTGRELVMFDLPGTGASLPPRRPLRMPQLARVVVGLLDALGYAVVDVLGYSLGGVVAQELAYRAPDRVGRLVLCATAAGPPGVPPDPRVVLMMLTPARYYSRRLGAAIVPRIAGGRTARDPRALSVGLDLRQTRPPSARGYAYQLYAVGGWSSQRWLHRLGHETLVVHGDDDPLVPVVNARWMARRIPHARLLVLAGAGHLFLLDEPDRAVPPIASFLDGGAHGAGA